jgi:hypothetical protein
MQIYRRTFKMAKTMEELEALRDRLRRQLFEIGDLRPGTVYPTYRRCGKKNCACAKPGHPGHLQYLRTTARGGKNHSKILRMGPELEKATKEAENYRQFSKLCRELVEINERICEIRPVRQVKDPEELEALKKKLQRRFAGKLRRK